MDINSIDIGALVPVFGTLIPIVAIVGHFWSDAAKQKELNETIRQMIAAGQTPPTELLIKMGGDNGKDDDKTPPDPATKKLQQAVVTLAIGIALLGTSHWYPRLSVLLLPGLIMALVGVALLLVYAKMPKNPSR